MDEKMSIDKKEDMREASVDSMESTPEADAGPPNQEHTEQPKRKGGRKPVCNTSRRYCAWQTVADFFCLDIRHLRGAQAAEPTGPGGFP